MMMEPSGFDISAPLQNGQFLLVIEGKPRGPYSVTQLKDIGIKPGDFLKTAGMDDYKEAHEIAQLRQLFGFEQQALPMQYFGNFDQRMLASALDWFIMFGAFLLPAFAAVYLVEDKASRIIIGLSLFVLVPVGKFFYHVSMESSARQATYGKQILKIRVADTNGQRIDRAKAFTRNLCKLLSTLPLFAGYLTAFFTAKRQCVHDIVAGTVVIKDRLD
jgi:uncharacterized RDD family membrane protein YckC